MMNFKEKLNKILSSSLVKKIKKRRLSTYFAFLTSSLIVIIIIFTLGYVVNHIKNLSIEYNTNLKTFNYSLSSLISETFAQKYSKEDMKGATYYINGFRARSMLTYAYAIDKTTQKVFWSTIPSIMNKDSLGAQGEVFFEYQGLDIMETVGNTQKYMLVLGLPLGKVGSSQLNILLENMKILVAIFISIGLAASALMSRIILKPLDELTAGVKEFAKGNFDFRLKESKFAEINELVGAYNYMAFQLQDLYDSLELKVQERTLALERANQEIKETQAMMVHSEKMRSLGELVAGIAHEINNPINFIHGNIMILDKYVKDMFKLIDLYVENEPSIDENEIKKISKIKADVDIDFIRDDVKDLIKSCIEGTDRTKNIVLDLKNFSRMEEMVLTQFNIPKEIDTTLNILNNKYKNRITIHKEYQENVPKIEALGGQLNQVFMNILDNAQYAIKGEGEVFISVKQVDNYVQIIFKDSGEGIKKEELKKVFEPFYTTKPVGQGTGLGMSITYRVIKNHNGDIEVDSQIGKGTTFIIKLPINLKNYDTINDTVQEC